MPSLRSLSCLLLGTEPRLRRLLSYWAATCAFYLVCIVFLWGEVALGDATPRAGRLLSAAGLAGLAVSYALVRASTGLRIAPWQLAFYQALFAIACNIAAYAVVGAIRGAALMVLLVIMVFCAFSLRPRQTRLLCRLTIGGLGATMLWLVHGDPAHHPVSVELLHFAVLCISLVAVTILTGELSKLRADMKAQKEELVGAMATIHTLATIDELTSLANRRHMHEVLRDEERRQATLSQPICLALLDIDFFKHINDKYGHAGGDAVLRSFAATAHAQVRSADVLARWGGEEFLLLLPDTELAEAHLVLARMAERIAGMRIPEVDPELRVTFSGGLVARRPQEALADAIKRADEAMYVAKSRGRDRIVAA